MRWSSALADSARPYLFTLITAAVIGKFGQYLWQYVWPVIPLIKGQAPGIWIPFLVVGVAAVLWLAYRGKRAKERWILLVLGSLALTWAVHGVMTRLHADQTPYTVLLLPLILMALWLKTPSLADLRAGVIYLAWLLAAILVLTRAAEMLGIIPMVDVGAPLVAFEQANYWLPLQGTLGPAGRWPGPMGHNAQTGNVAALLLIVGLGLRGRSRWVLVAIGILTLLLTSSRTSYLGAVAGVVVLLVLDDNPLTRFISRRLLLPCVGALGLVAAGIVLLQNRNLTGRTTYWSLAYDAWSSSPWTGVGSDALNGAALNTMGTNAHNILIDAALKFGVLGLLAVMLLLVLGLVVAAKAAVRRVVLPLALVVTFIVIGLAEADDGWLGVSVMWLWFVLPTLWAARSLGGSPREQFHA